MHDLDRRLAEMIGWTYTEHDDIGGGKVRRWSNATLASNWPYNTPASYSEDISACFGQLIPWLKGKGWTVEVLDAGHYWRCVFRKEGRGIASSADTPEMAIALAAEAVGMAEGWIAEGQGVSGPRPSVSGRVG